MSTGVRPIHLPGATALETIRARMAAALSAWATEWLSEPGDALAIDVEVHRPNDEKSRPRLRLDAAAGSLWFDDDVDSRGRLLRAVMGDEAISSLGQPVDAWSAGIGQQAWQARNEALCTALLGDPIRTSTAPLDAELGRFGSGALQIRCARLGLHAVVDSGALRHVPPSSVAPRPVLPTRIALDRALGPCTIDVDVALGVVGLDLERLLGLQPGDVIRLPTRLDEPLELRLAGAVVARGGLGEHLEHRCFQPESAALPLPPSSS